MRNLAVIPARAGSTRLKDKNIHPLGGKPLIRWITEAVVVSGCYQQILISTDSDDIFDAVKDLGIWGTSIQRHYRSNHLANDKTTVLEAILNLMSEKNNDGYDTISYFLPTCPFISSRDIKDGMYKLNPAVDSVISMTEFYETIQLACLISRSDDVMPVFDNLEKGLTNSRYIKKYYKPSGGFYMGWWDSVINRKSFFVGDVKGVIIPKERSIDINTIHDIKYAEMLLENKINV